MLRKYEYRNLATDDLSMKETICRIVISYTKGGEITVRKATETMGLFTNGYLNVNIRIFIFNTGCAWRANNQLSNSVIYVSLSMISEQQHEN